MKLTHKLSFAAVLLCGAMLFAAGCGEKGNGNTNYKDDVKEGDKNFALLTPGEQEEEYDYKFNFLPEVDSVGQGYIGDTMPYYEDGTYYIYYLKDKGDSFNHSIYLTTTTDFVHYTEVQDPILVSGVGAVQDSMIGTGSVVKVKEKYYFFYTGHGGSTMEYKEKIMVAVGTSPTSFTKKEGWEITPEADIGQKNDFRDPQAYYDAASDTITLTVTAAHNDVACVYKYTIGGELDLSTLSKGEIIYTNNESIVGDVWNVECSDTFQVGGKWYLTFSAQDGVMWYVPADTQYEPYNATPKPLDGELFYAAKHASDGNNTYLIGWSRRSESVSSTQDISGWAGNLQVQKVVSDGKGGIMLAPVDAYLQNTEERVLVSGSSLEVKAGDYTEAFRCFERYLVTGKFTCKASGKFGFAFNYNNRIEKYKTITLSPAENKIGFELNLGDTPIASVPASLEAGKTYAFTYLQEGSIGVLYVEGQTALTVRVYGVSGRNVMLWAEGESVSFTDLKQFTYTY